MEILFSNFLQLGLDSAYLFIWNLIIEVLSINI